VSSEPPNPREFGTYVELAQVGIEMVAPLGVGLALDFYLHWSPWGAVTGAILGLVTGIAHLVSILNRQDQSLHSPGRTDKRDK
jgi:F0F1-type ATP synthase assembly protein I